MAGSAALAPPALDTRVSAEAPEGILLELRPAGVPVRFLAFAIDLAIRVALFTALLVPFSAMGGLGLALLLITAFVLEWFYPVLFELKMSGATPGKRALGLKVLMDSGLPVTPAASITRNLLRFADFLPAAYGFGVLSMLLRTDFKRLGDLAAGTLVVYDVPPARVPPLPAATPMAPLQTLSARQSAALIALATRAPRLTPERLEELARLADAVTGADAVGVRESRSERLFSVAQWLYGHR